MLGVVLMKLWWEQWSRGCQLSERSCGGCQCGRRRHVEGIGSGRHWSDKTRVAGEK
jgi:hypothetical protein